jgi:H/ACA ribonucleoprotein complex subunit 4
VQGISRLSDRIEKGDITAMLSLKGEFVAFGNALMTSQEMFKAGKGLAVKTDKVLISQKAYPKKW